MALLALAALGSLVYRELLALGRVLTTFDALVYFYPNIEYAAQSLKSGRLPLWNPYLFGGAPFLANSQTGVLYPANWPFWLLPTPIGYSLNAFAHTLLAAAGAYAVGRVVLRIGPLSATAGAAVFAFGGFFSAQIGHLNQLQSAAWLPWLAVLAWKSARSGSVRWAAGTALALAAQVLAGHSQVVYLTCFLLAVVWVAGAFALLTREGPAGRRQVGAAAARRLLLPVLIGTLALGISAAQLLPTLELTREGIRSDGLSFRDAAAFSLPPWDALVALLPTLDGPQVSSEWVSYTGITGLLLCLVAFLRGGRRAFLPLLVAAGALLMAFGQYLPTYQLLFEYLPGLSLYRVPARWLLLYSAGVAALAALGLAALGSATVLQTARGRMRPALAVAPALLVCVIVVSAAALARRWQVAMGIDVPVPGDRSLVMWTLTVIAAIGAIVLATRKTGSGPSGATRAWAPAGRLALVLLLFAELALAAGRLDVADGTITAAPEDRPQSVQFLTALLGWHRVLAFSDNSFEHGNIDDLRRRYAGVLTDDELTEYVIALKYAETLTPNLPLADRVQSIDGYDGGLLPLKLFAGIKSLFPLDGKEVSDGRLKLRLVRPPDPGLLAWLDISHVVMDRRRDVWRDGIYFDTAFDSVVRAGDTLSLPVSRPDATGIGVIARSESSTSEAGARVNVIDLDGRSTSCDVTVPAAETVLTGANDAFPKPADVAWCWLDRATGISEVQIANPTGPTVIVSSLSVSGPRDELSQVVPIQDKLRLVHLSDVKIYEQTSTVSRVWLPSLVTAVDSQDDALQAMREPTFDGRDQAVVVATDFDPALVGKGLSAGSASIASYEPERIEITVRASEPRLLVLTDSWYPGWQATVNGAPAAIVRVDYAFRGVLVPAGDSTVEMIYRPGLLSLGGTVTGISVVITLVLVLVPGRLRRPVLE